MGIALHFDYKFELDGKVYEARGVDFGETESESDIAKLNEDIKDLKISAICNAFDLSIEEYEENKIKFENAKFDIDFFEVFN